MLFKNVLFSSKKQSFSINVFLKSDEIDSKMKNHEFNNCLLYFNYLYILILLFDVWLHWVFIAACGLSLVAERRGFSSLRCLGFSFQWLLLLLSTGSRHMGFSNCCFQALELRLSNSGARAWLLQGMWNLPRPGLKPMSPVLVSGFLTTRPPGKSLP